MLPKYPTSAEYIREVNRLCDMSFRFARLAGAGVFFATEFVRRRNTGGVSVYKDVYAGTVTPIHESSKRAREYARKTAVMARRYRKSPKLQFTDAAIDCALYCADIAGYVAAQDRGYKAEIAAEHY